MTGLSVFLLISGFVLLVAGGEALVRGAAALGKKLGMPSLIIGLTVVAFASSAPELAVSVTGVLSGSPGLAVGNVIGSNIANILFVLGLTAVFAALVVSVRLVKIDILVMIGFSALALLLALDGEFSALDGVILLGLFAVYLSLTIWYARRQSSNGHQDRLGVEGVLAQGPGGKLRAKLRQTPLGCNTIDTIMLLGGLGLLVAGAWLLVDAATTIATALGVSELIIGLTVVAIGTSLPELITSVIAAIRGERDMAIGNLVGSNIFNIGVVLGISSIVSPTRMVIDPAAINFDLPVMVAVALVLLPLVFAGRSISQWEGALLVVIYVAYVAYLVLSGGHHQGLQPFSAPMLWFVLPVTAVWLIAFTSYELGLRRRSGIDQGPPFDYLSSPPASPAPSAAKTPRP